MIVTEDLIRLLSFCEAHKHRQAVYKSSVSLQQALKMSLKNVEYLKNYTDYETPIQELCFYDPDLHIAFSIGVVKVDTNTIQTFKKIKTYMVGKAEDAISKIALSFLHKQGYEIEQHLFINADELSEIENWDKTDFDFGAFSREAETLSFWVHGLLQKKFKPVVSEKACRVCKLAKSCKNYMRYTKVQMDDLISEFV